MCDLCLPSAASQILPSTKPGYDPVPNSEPDATTIGLRAAMSSTFNEMSADVWNVVTKLAQCSNQIKLQSMPTINAGTDALTTMLYVLGAVAMFITALHTMVKPQALIRYAVNMLSAHGVDVICSILAIIGIATYTVTPKSGHRKTVTAVAVFVMFTMCQLSGIGVVSVAATAAAHTSHSLPIYSIPSDIVAAAVGAPVAAAIAALQPNAKHTQVVAPEVNTVVTHDPSLSSSFLFEALMDTGANVSAVPSESFLISVESRQRLEVDNVGPQDAASVAIGTMRIEFTDKKR